MSLETPKGEDLPKGVTCKCGEFSPFSMWVYAHWGERLSFVCPECGAKYSVYKGQAKASS